MTKLKFLILGFLLGLIIGFRCGKVRGLREAEDRYIEFENNIDCVIYGDVSKVLPD